MFKRLLLLTMVITLSLATTAFAASEEWFDKKYDFTKTKKVLILNPTISREIDSEVAEKNIFTRFWEKAKIKNVKILKIDNIYTLITADTGIDLKELHQQDPEKAQSILMENMAKYADLIVYTDVKYYNIGSKYIEAHYSTETYYETSYIYDANGKQTEIRIPRTRTVFVPATTVPTLTTQVEFKVIDTKTNESVFLRTDNRYRVSGLFQSSTPVNMYRRAVSSFFDDLNAKINR